MNYVPIDYARSCRLCLSDRGIRKPIFEDEKHDSVDKHLPSKILSCVSIKVEKEDPYPLWICQHCQMKIDEIYEFRNLCKMSDAILKSNYNILGKQRKNLNLPENIEPRNSVSLPSCMMDSNRFEEPVSDTLMKVGETNSIIDIKQEPIDSSEYSTSEPTNEVFIKQEGEENFLNEDLSTEPTDESDSHMEDKTEFSESRDQNYAFSKEMKQEELEGEKRETEILYSNEDNPPVHFLLENNSIENVNECKEKYTSRNRKILLKCPICTCPFLYQAAYNKHIMECEKKGAKMTRQNKRPTCNICGAILESDGALVEHEKFHRYDPQYFITTATSNLPKVPIPVVRRFQLQSGDGKVPFKRRKPRIQPKDTVFMCSICNIEFAQKGELICHQAMHHRAQVNKNIAQQKTFACDVCSLSFAHKGEYILHKEFSHTASRLTSRLPVYRLVLINGTPDLSQNLAENTMI